MSEILNNPLSLFGVLFLGSIFVVLFLDLLGLLKPATSSKRNRHRNGANRRSGSSFDDGDYSSSSHHGHSRDSGGDSGGGDGGD